MTQFRDCMYNYTQEHTAKTDQKQEDFAQKTARRDAMLKIHILQANPNPIPNTEP